MWVNGHLIDTAFKKNQKRRKIRRRSFTSSIKREIMPFVRRSHAVTAKKCTKKCDARAKVLFFSENPL